MPNYLFFFGNEVFGAHISILAPTQDEALAILKKNFSYMKNGISIIDCPTEEIKDFRVSLNTKIITEKDINTMVLPAVSIEHNNTTYIYDKLATASCPSCKKNLPRKVKKLNPLVKHSCTCFHCKAKFILNLIDFH